jgi:hypothetical protein
VPIFIGRKLVTTSSPVDARKPKRSFFFFAPRSGTAPSENSERSGLIINKESAACFIRVWVPNVKDEPRPWLARLVLLGARDVPAMVVGSSAWFGSSFISRLV